MSIEAMMLSCAKDAKENRFIVVSDIPGAFLHTDMDNNVHMLLEGTVTESGPNNIQKTYMLNQTWQAYAICTTKKSPTWNSISSTTILETAISDTTGVGYTLNPCNKCKVIKDIIGKLCTIIGMSTI